MFVNARWTTFGVCHHVLVIPLDRAESQKRRYAEMRKAAVEFRRHHNEEVAGDDGLGVITHERHPALLRVGGPRE